MTVIPVIVGPTAVGKTAISIRVAESLGAEIISADSRQIFRELSIGTAKPSATELAAVRHHFVDERTITERYSAGIFQRDATERIDELALRGTAAVVAGGSTLYVHALLFGLNDIPDVDPAVVDSTNQELAVHGATHLHNELRILDPESAARIDPTKSHRIVRALSVVRATGRPIGTYFGDRTPSARYRVFFLELDRRELYRRIDQRVDSMLEAGLVSEVRQIATAGFDPSLQPLQSIGYKEMFEHLDGQPLDVTIRLIKRNSRRYAKRQLTWFRRYENVTRIPADRPLADIADTIMAAVT